MENGDFVKKFDRDDVPEYSPAIYVYSSLRSAESCDIKSNGDVPFCEGECDCGKFIIYFSHTGYPEKIMLCQNKSTVYFKNTVKTFD